MEHEAHPCVENVARRSVRTPHTTCLVALQRSETNGCAEKFIQTLKEQVLWIERFHTFEELRGAVRGFAVTYNHDWLLERHSYRTPTEAREHLLNQALVA